jgi:hypothetical protein
MLKRIAVAVALLVPAVAAAEERVGTPASGGFVDFRLGFGLPIAASFVPLAGTGGAPVQSQEVSVIPHLAGGFRVIDRIQIGLGFSYFRSSLTTGTTLSSTVAYNLFYFTPFVVIDFARTHDRRAAFYGKFGLPLGADIITQSRAPDSNGFIVGYDFTLGARYAFHPAFALGLETGLLGTFINPERDDANVAFTTFYSSLVGTFYFAGR